MRGVLSRALRGSDDGPQRRQRRTAAEYIWCRLQTPAGAYFQPGQSGNPSGRTKGSQNLKTLFNKILKEQVSLREGADVRKVSKAEAIMRGLIVGALKGDSRSIGTLFRLAEQTGQFEEPGEQTTQVVVRWFSEGEKDEVPAIRQLNRD